MVAVEKVKYVPDPNNPNETIAYKEAWVESGLYGLRYELPIFSHKKRCSIEIFVLHRSAVKTFGIERFKQNCTKATEGFNHVLFHLHQMKQVREKKWTEMKEMKQKGVEALRDKITVKALNTEES